MASASTRPPLSCRYLAPSWEPYGGALWALACLLPPSAVSLFAHVLLQQESVGSGVTWRNLGEGVTVESYFSGGVVLLMLLLDVALFAVLTWYFDQVRSEGGDAETTVSQRGNDCIIKPCSFAACS